MNYGFAELDLPSQWPILSSDEKRDRYAIQLYQHVIESVNLLGANVLEVGCGHGGGISYVKRNYQPYFLIGVDISPKSLELCNRRHATRGLSFVAADAGLLPFGDATFEVVLSIESSHCFWSMERFLAEACRILRPNGHLLLADARVNVAAPLLRRQLESSGLEMIREEVITPQVRKAIVLRHKQLASRERRWASWLHQSWQTIAMISRPGMLAIRTGLAQYLYFVLRKPRQSW